MIHDRDSLPISDDPRHLHKVLKEFSTVMLGTFDQTGAQPSLRARPMHVADIAEDCSLQFISRRPSEKVAEAASTHIGHVFAQSRTQFVSMQGEIVVSTDRDTLRRLWSKAYEVWLSGPDDPNAVLVVFKPHNAELWDASGLKGLRFLLQSARSLVTGDRQPKYGDDMHERVHMTR